MKIQDVNIGGKNQILALYQGYEREESLED